MLPSIALAFTFLVHLRLSQARWQWVCGITCERLLGVPSPYTLPCIEGATNDGGMAGMDMSMGDSSVAAMCMASDPNYLSSQAWCLHERCIPLGGQKKVDWYWNFLQEENEVEFPSYASVLPSSQPPDIPSGLTVLNATYRINDSVWDINYGSNLAYDDNDNTQVKHGLAFIVLFFATLVIAVLVRFVSDFTWKPYDAKSWHTSAPATFVKKHLVYPALFNGRHNEQMFGGFVTLPTRLLTFYVVGLFAIGVTLSCVNYRSFQPNTTYPWRSLEMWGYVGVAGGDLFLAVAPLVWFAAARHNVNVTPTGWGYETFQVIHRWLGMLAFLYALVHTVAYAVNYGLRGSWTAAYLSSPWFIWGAVAMVAMLILVFGALRPIREQFYETFLVVHILMAVFTIVGTQLHIVLLYGQEYHYRKWMWSVVAVWSADRAARLFRLIVLNWGATFRSQCGTVHIVPGTGNAILRLTAPVPRGLCSPAPGQHFFVYFPWLTLRVWENHPLSVAGWTSSPGATGQLDNFHFLVYLAKKAAVPDTVTFYVLAEEGATGSLRKRALQGASARNGSDGMAPLRILLEGPYGHTKRLSQYETVVLIAGGVGVAPTLSYVQAHAERAGRTGRLVFVFVARQIGFVREIVRHLTDTNLLSHIDLRLFCTGEEKTARGSLSEVQDEKMPEEDSLILDGVTYARPDMSEIIQAEVRIAASSSDRTAFFVCGPAGMGDTARQAFVNSLGKDADGDKVGYFEEALCW